MKIDETREKTLRTQVKAANQDARRHEKSGNQHDDAAHDPLSD